MLRGGRTLISQRPNSKTCSKEQPKWFCFSRCAHPRGVSAALQSWTHRTWLRAATLSYLPPLLLPKDLRASGVTSADLRWPQELGRAGRIGIALQQRASSQKGTSRQGCRAGPRCPGTAVCRGPSLAAGGCHLCPTVGTAGPGAPGLAGKKSASVSVGVRDAAEHDRFLSAAICLSCLHRARFALSPN